MERRRTDQAGGHRAVRVLAVDDDPRYLKYLERVLTRAGFEVSTVDGGCAAIERVKTDRAIDLMLVDLTMPDIDGIETVKRVQSDVERPLYSVLLTAHDATETKVRALESGLDDFITKMTPESEMVARLRSVARRIDHERELQVRNQQLEAMALTDELTGVANRRALFCTGKRLIAENASTAVVLFDLDGFKHINDTYGHRTGDEILAGVAATFRQATRADDLVARLGGDEFVIVLPGLSATDGETAARRIADLLANARWDCGGKQLQLSTSYGVSVSPDDGSSLDPLLNRCDERLYRAKAMARQQRAS
ncbi:MAG TPA: diguanylate cyclase [Thermoanaerobaculia bacterium]|nr:diguanylate cyclase [Thermoanaerobaculia bacterium]